LLDVVAFISTAVFRNLSRSLSPPVTDRKSEINPGVAPALSISLPDGWSGNGWPTGDFPVVGLFSK
jgi:hypothetical protein